MGFFSKCLMICSKSSDIDDPEKVFVNTVYNTGMGVGCDEKKPENILLQGGTPRKIMKQIDPFGAFWCILFNYNNGLRRPKKKRKSVKKLKTLMPDNNIPQDKVPEQSPWQDFSFTSNISHGPDSLLSHVGSWWGKEVDEGYHGPSIHHSLGLVTGAGGHIGQSPGCLELKIRTAEKQQVKYFCNY